MNQTMNRVTPKAPVRESGESLNRTRVSIPTVALIAGLALAVGALTVNADSSSKSNAGSVVQEIRAERFVLVDSKGRKTAELCNGPYRFGPGLTLYDSKGQTRLRLSLCADEGPLIACFDKGGEKNGNMVIQIQEALQAGSVIVRGPKDISAILTAGGSHVPLGPMLELDRGLHGNNPSMIIGVGDDIALLKMIDKNGKCRISHDVKPDGSAKSTVMDKNEKVIGHIP